VAVTQYAGRSGTREVHGNDRMRVFVLSGIDAF
jgi:hypothetical protein